ncbi:MAG: purine-nucleoside phosphorylase [Bacillota bacterium]|uniref:Purine nucleoside phosphorylase n=2 Tax=Carboxydocella TaxID=178898 RepID=A0A1T4NJT1_9FIRM|nr:MULTISPECIES: purine-nucleoside phosphorylase [Carboxydocella]AVX20076.1 purine-nucleoside phosphorylase [Carboxydocella thermautotrophica]GAW27848.1 purine-nucleoside phosphorylase [Carboxydocella sp. ULO1]GAW32669.1 purine-nucleoside phosphorylase [Carboxydocella sp. JDF658]SJZ79522.1 purine-nucleoside phosphorylase [Carboxydocella sporoproducens DSM 16521]
MERAWKVKLTEAVEYIRRHTDYLPEIALILGSGLGALAEEIEEAVTIPYRELPHFPVSTVEGHAGRLVLGKLKGKTVVAMQGRFHYYEGYSMGEVTFPVRVMKLLGARQLFVTNAAGGINREFKPGDLMLITDHINLMGSNPLIGPNWDDFGPRFPDMSAAYSARLQEIADRVAASQGFKLQRGVYAAMTGPSYETPAEIRYLAKIGADAVGMSTVPEVIVANHSGMEVLGISCITNMAAGILPEKLDHSEVMETAERIKKQFLALVKGIVELC